MINFSEENIEKRPIEGNSNTRIPNMQIPIMDAVSSGKPPLLNTEYILNTKTPPPPKYKLSTERKEKYKNIDENKTNKEEWRWSRCRDIDANKINNKDCFIDENERSNIISSYDKNNVISDCAEYDRTNSYESNNKDIYEFYTNNGFGKINSVVIDLLNENIKKFSKEAVKRAMIEAIKNNKYTLTYKEERVLNNAYAPEGNQQQCFLTKTGLYEVLMQIDTLLRLLIFSYLSENNTKLISKYDIILLINVWLIITY